MDNHAQPYIQDLKRDYLFYFSRLLNRVMVGPDMLQIMLTPRCNLRCKICDVWKQEFAREMTTEEVKSLIDQAIELGVKTIYFTGGEALLREDIFELINYASRPGIITTINTNGSIITDEIAKKIVLSKLQSIVFSIDSANPILHNAIRGNGVFEKAMEGFRHISRYKKEFNRAPGMGERGGLEVGMVSVIMGQNIEELPRLVELASEMGCCAINFQPLVHNGNLLESANFQSDFWPQARDIAKLKNVFQELESLNREKMMTGPHIDFMAEKTIQHFLRERRTNTCFAGFNRIFVNPQGAISFVCFESFANITETSLRSAWFSEKASMIRFRIKECKVNCTQFCSERPASEDLHKIHDHFIREMGELLGSESSFLKEMIGEVEKQAALDTSQDFNSTLQQIKDLRASIKK